MAITVRRCTEHAIVVNPDSTVYVARYPDASGTIDLTNIFTSQSFDDSPTKCSFKYALETVASLPTYDEPPYYISIPDATVPTIAIGSPLVTDTALGSRIFRVKAYFDGYDSDFPTHIASTELTINLETYCLTTPTLSWGTTLATSYTVELGSTTTISFDEAQTHETSYPTHCGLDFSYSGTIWSTSTATIPIITAFS